MVRKVVIMVNVKSRKVKFYQDFQVELGNPTTYLRDFVKSKYFSKTCDVLNTRISHLTAFLKSYEGDSRLQI